jgi:hypothetical protein
MRLRLTTRRMMVGVAVVAVNFAAIRALYALTGHAVYNATVPLLAAEAAALRCWAVYGRSRAFWAAFVVTDLPLTMQLVACMIFDGVPGSAAWDWYSDVASNVLQSVGLQHGYYPAPTLDLIAIWIVLALLPIGVLACLAGLVARWAFDLWTRRHRVMADNATPQPPES